MSVRTLSVLALAAVSAAVLPGCSTVSVEEYNKMATAQKEYIEQLEERNKVVELENADLRRLADGAALAKTTDELYAQIARQLEKALRDFGGDEDGELSFKDGRWTLGTDLLFETGSWTVSAKGKDLLKKFAEAHRAQTVRFRIVGHTDRAPIVTAALKAKLDTDTNMELSVRRAVAVMAVLKGFGMAESAFGECVGMGNMSPRAPNDRSAANMKKNRRVEIFVLGKATAPTSAPKSTK